MRKASKEENKKFIEVVLADKQSSQQLATTLEELILCNDQISDLHSKLIERYDQFKWTLENENKQIEARDQQLTDEMINEIRKNMKQIYKQYAVVKDSLVKKCKAEELAHEREKQEINKKLKEIKSQLAFGRSNSQKNFLKDQQKAQEARLEQLRAKMESERKEREALQKRYEEWLLVREK